MDAFVPILAAAILLRSVLTGTSMTRTKSGVTP
jgi:hypothetical protein